MKPTWEYALTQWSYTATDPLAEVQAEEVKRLNEMGAEGWELVESDSAILGNTQYVNCIWKRVR